MQERERSELTQGYSMHSKRGIQCLAQGCIAERLEQALDEAVVEAGRAMTELTGLQKNLLDRLE